jgi:hypothetical protein
MEGLNPNSPPPKMTEVKLQKWEYTDPVGVPHPDKVDVVVVLTNEGATAAKDVTASIDGQWHIGPIKSESAAGWTSETRLQTWQALTVAPGNPSELRVAVDLAALMSELEKEGQWPWTFRALLTVGTAGGEKPLLTREVDLPIRPGD